MNPLRLEVNEGEGAVTVRVVGSSTAEFRGRLELRTSGSGNQSTHRGTVSLAAGEKAVLSTFTLVDVDSWEAVLGVESTDGTRYEERASGPA